MLAYQKQTYNEPLHKLDRKQKSDLPHEKIALPLNFM